MPAHSKIVNETEVLKWFEEGRTYSWMVEEYRRKYDIETSPTMWSNWRKRRGLDGRHTRDDELIPWHVKQEHRFAYPLNMLRYEARLRAGADLTDVAAQRLESWKQTLAESNAVVYYDPDTAEGFHYVPREKKDTDLIRRPKQKTGRSAG